MSQRLRHYLSISAISILMWTAIIFSSARIYARFAETQYGDNFVYVRSDEPIGSDGMGAIP